MTPKDESAVALHHISVKRTARYAVLGHPGPSVRDVWMVCHGHAQLAKNFVERFRVIDAPDRVIVAPEALNHYYLDGGFRGASSRVGATWMTTEDREAEIEDYVAYLDELHDEIFRLVPRAQSRLTVLGFSQGVATAARWVAAGKANPDRVVLWAGSLPTELSESGAKRLMGGGDALRIVVGDADQFITPKILDTQITMLDSLGVSPAVMRFRGGHEIDGPTLVSIAMEE